MMKVYLAGPMRGIPHFNFPAFHAHAKALRAQGHEVYSPAERDEDTYGAEFSLDNMEGDEEKAKIEFGLDKRGVFADDMEYICLHADAVAVMPGWQMSKGAFAERALGEALGLKIIYLAEETI